MINHCEKTVLILGANGFIGSHLTEEILKKTSWHVLAFDLHDFNLQQIENESRFSFKKGNIFEDREWIEQAIQKSDVVLPLIAIANPSMYVKAPLKVFELDFEANLQIVRLCVAHKKRIIFPSTSEVYGMSPDQSFDEEKSNFVQGPINRSRWIYSCSKQLLDRVIAAYGEQEGLAYTIFRPFNFMGPRLDRLDQTGSGASRAFTQFIANIMRGEVINLVDGGKQRRCYIYIDDAIAALIKIIENPEQKAAQRIFNIGNPENNISMCELVHLIAEEMSH